MRSEIESRQHQNRDPNTGMSICLGL